MFSEENVNCPECGKNNGTLMHLDQFPCKCGETVIVKYYGCACGFSWRTSDDLFVDGMKIDVDTIDEIMDGAEDLFEGLEKLSQTSIKVDPFHVPTKFKNMADMIHKCLQCGEIAVEKRENFFECTDPNCGFTWEVDECDGS